ncbi:RNA processing factor Prp31 [Methanofollis sp. W23]|uniref:hypothetical protein n=1 Tax=Methanofollis sp. W23 TaxID=2817849 RepID=UPI001AE9E40E|nr:hypothetical protein [Methanofollis sp. W23]MBP2145451.1 RNA processing factor Prp31 [Methanofollis sp. W23]
MHKLVQTNIDQTKQDIKVALARDEIMKIAMRLLRDLDHNVPNYYNRLIEFFKLYFPEAEHKIQSPKQLLMLAQKGAQREVLAKRLKISSQSFGLDLRMKDIKFIEQFASMLLISGKMKKNELFVVETKKYIQELVAELTPNMAKIASYRICAELVERAGGLRNLAFLPASRIQLLGAETALFRHIRTGAKPPKYGVLFQHATVKSVEPQEKGKNARRIACKLAIAARKDYARIYYARI